MRHGLFVSAYLPFYVRHQTNVAYIATIEPDNPYSKPPRGIPQQRGRSPQIGERPLLHSRRLSRAELKQVARATGMEFVEREYQLRNPWSRKGVDCIPTDAQLVADSVAYIEGISRQKPVDADADPVLAQVQRTAQAWTGIKGPNCKGQAQTTDSVTPHLLVVAVLNDFVGASN